MEKTWANASLHTAGQGLQLGRPAFGPALSTRAFLRRKDLQREAAALTIALCGGTWTLSRWEGKPSAEQMCRRCGIERETPFHRYYACAANQEISDDQGWLRETAWVARLPQHKLLRYECVLPNARGTGSERRERSNVESRARIWGCDPLSSAYHRSQLTVPALRKAYRLLSASVGRQL